MQNICQEGSAAVRACPSYPTRTGGAERRRTEDRRSILHSPAPTLATVLGQDWIWGKIPQTMGMTGQKYPAPWIPLHARARGEISSCVIPSPGVPRPSVYPAHQQICHAVHSRCSPPSSNAPSADGCDAFSNQGAPPSRRTHNVRCAFRGVREPIIVAWTTKQEVWRRRR